MTPCLQRALACLDRGFPTIPIDHSTKRPTAKWKPFQTMLPTVDWLCEKFTAQIESIAVLTGHSSGGLYCLDFDIADYYHRWLAEVESHAAILPAQQTGKGYQVLWQCSDPGRSTKLAAIADPSQKCGWRVAIECRANRAYACIDPARHPNGKYYTFIHLDLLDVPFIDMEMHNFLVSVARSFNQVEGLQKKSAQVVANDSIKQLRIQRAFIGGGTGDVITAWNSRISVADILGASGYRVDHDEFWRPNKCTSLGSSGIIARCDDDVERSVHFSTNDVLNDEKFGEGTPCGIHDSFDTFMTLELKGDMKAAVREAARLLGMKKPTFTDNDLIAICLNDPVTGEHFGQLFAGVIGDLEVDLARAELIRLLLVHTDFEKQIHRILKKSALRLEVAA